MWCLWMQHGVHSAQARVTHIAQGGATGLPARAVGLPGGQCHHACPSGPTAHPWGARRAVSKRGAPTCQGLGLHGDGDHDSHVVLLCVRTPN